MAPHSSTLAWKIPWTEEPVRLQSMGLLRVGHNWATSLLLSRVREGNGNPLQCSCLENPRDGGAWWAAVYGVAQSRTRLKWLSIVSISRSLVSNSLRPHGLKPARLLCPWDSPGKNTGVGCHFFLQGIFLTQGWSLCLLHCRWVLYHWATREASCTPLPGHEFLAGVISSMHMGVL